TFKEVAVLGHIRRTSVSQAFRGGEVTTFMGGVDLDLRDCRMATNEARINFSIVMGGVELRIPRDWVVESRMSLIMAGLDDRSTPAEGGATKRLVIDGSALLGGIEIRN